MSSEVIKCPTIGAASFGQSPYIASYLPVRGVVGHNIDRCIISKFQKTKLHLLSVIDFGRSGVLNQIWIG